MLAHPSNSLMLQQLVCALHDLRPVPVPAMARRPVHCPSHLEPVQLSLVHCSPDRLTPGSMGLAPFPFVRVQTVLLPCPPPSRLALTPHIDSPRAVHRPRGPTEG